MGSRNNLELCVALAPNHDAAVMAGAVVNWIPAEPFPGKMPTDGYEVGDQINVPFVLAPRVIHKMRKVNPKLTLIGCKMLVGSSRGALLGAAEKVIRASKAHVVVANDQTDLHTKLLVFPDRTVIELADLQHAFEWEEKLYEPLRALIEDRHWHTETFDAIVDKYRDRFFSGGGDLVFGSLLVPVGQGHGYLVSPRTKTGQFTSKDAVWVAPDLDTEFRGVLTSKGAKATLNAPLLVSMALVYPPQAVLHLHEQLPDVPTQGYAPPGTDRDCFREIPGPAFNIKGHGFIATLGPDLEISKDA